MYIYTRVWPHQSSVTNHVLGFWHYLPNNLYEIKVFIIKTMPEIAYGDRVENTKVEGDELKSLTPS